MLAGFEVLSIITCGEDDRGLNTRSNQLPLLMLRDDIIHTLGAQLVRHKELAIEISHRVWRQTSHHFLGNLSLPPGALGAALGRSVD